MPIADFVQTMISRHQQEMLHLLEQYGIWQVSELQRYLETAPSVNVDGASAFANANQFTISGGSFPTVGGNQVVATIHSKDGSMDAQTLSIQQAIATASRYAEQSPRNPFRNPSSLQGSSGAIRTENRTSVSISGASVLANASHFEFGEGVKMFEGALSAVAKNQFILEQGYRRISDYVYMNNWKATESDTKIHMTGHLSNN
ncbi:MAG: hypothetical protein NXY57DRAFT_1041981 [Lentinula lateritia]|nr:MAG: hypothetical protein NXY57DRAFT_1041981 [Lentinula lateritia]